jgi:acetylornithine deacetylase/succinyl-diaminopimelate desuccinylase family protein
MNAASPGAWNEVSRWIDGARDDIVEELRTLVRIRSVTGEEATIGAHVLAICRELGFETERIEAEPGRPNVLACWDSGTPGPEFLLNDHLDTIPPGPLEYWTHAPFAADVADGMVYGRGTIDTKSGLTTILATARALNVNKVPIRGKLKLLFTCDEEVGGAKGIQHVAACGKLKADLALVTEPTTLQVEIATKGRLNIGITTRGVATHGARPWLGHNAIEDMADIIVALRELEPALAARSHPLLGRPSINVGLISGGTVPNMVPNKCSLEVDRRFLPSETREGCLEEIRAVVTRAARGRKGSSAEVKELLWWAGYEISPEAEIVQRTVRAFEAVMDRTPVVAGKDAGTDASWINLLGGIPVAMFSPGNGKQVAFGI